MCSNANMKSQQLSLFASGGKVTKLSSPFKMFNPLACRDLVTAMHTY